ncbi:MAG: wax ester/triacylglycerol synthase family O-acyltransferase [Actinomycetota bacterium]|nr:wax ester/triacylglycerol synthase family O-acyltransferase [Actinomycetota bacterium]
MRMSDTEAIMWAVEKDPALRSDFCNLTILEERPADKRLDQTLTRALAAIPRLQQRVVSAPLRIVPPEFADDPTLDLAYHVRRMSLPWPGDMRALLDACASTAETPLDRSRPLWEFTLFEGLADGRAALLQKVHHTISDGVGALKLSLALLDLQAEPQSNDADPEPRQVATPRTGTAHVLHDSLTDAAARGGRVARGALSGAGDMLAHPTQVPGRAADAARFVSSLRRQALVANRARSDVMRDRTLRRHFEVHTLSLPAMRAAASALGGSVNDLYVTGLAAALGRYHARHDSDVAQLRLAMPISTRGRGDAGANRFVPSRVLIPIHPADDPRALLVEVRERLAATKNESALPAIDSLSGLVSGLPTSMLVRFTRSQTRTIDFTASNLRGSPIPLYLAGSRIVANYPFGPRTGTAVNVTMLGYCDELHLGINVDPAAVTDIEALLDDIREAFADLLGSGYANGR